MNVRRKEGAQIEEERLRCVPQLQLNFPGTRGSMTHFPVTRRWMAKSALITLEELDTITILPHPQREVAFWISYCVVFAPRLYAVSKAIC